MTGGDCEGWLATCKVTLATKSLLFEYLVPERVEHAVGTGSTSRVQIRSRPRRKSRKGFFWEETAKVRANFLSSQTKVRGTFVRHWDPDIVPILDQRSQAPCEMV
jgi:hypothetical protein